MKIGVNQYDFFSPIFSQRESLIRKMLEKDQDFFDLMILFERIFKQYYFDRSSQNTRLYIRLRTHLSREMLKVKRKPTYWSSKKLKKEFDLLLK